MNSDSIPVDLITEIFSRLPQKSIARFHCVSKLWASILRGPYFTELFLTRSSDKPRLLFAIEEEGVWGFFSSHQRQNPYEKSSVAAEFHMKFPPENMKIYSYDFDRRFACGYTSGLVYFYGMWIKGEDCDGVPVICNPNTGQYVTLPYLLRYRSKSYSFFGFDPIDKQLKVLFIAYPGSSDNHKIMTLGTRKMEWRTIKCPLLHIPLWEGMCINGVLYYLGDCEGYVKVDVVNDESSDYDYVIVCFDVRSEKFKFIYVQNNCTLINYKGKLCAIYWEGDDVYWKDDVINGIELRMWILEDAEKQEWSKYAYTLWDDKFFFVDDRYTHIDLVGVTTMGEIILSMGYYMCNQPFYVFYFNPEKNTLQRVEIQGFGEYYHEVFTKQNDNAFSKKHVVYTFADHIEDLKVNDTIKHLCLIREENKKMKKMKIKKKMKKKKDKMKNRKGKENIGVR